MKNIMKLEELASITQMSAFLSGTQAVAFSVLSNKEACYRWVQTLYHNVLAVRLFDAFSLLNSASCMSAGKANHR
jgi:hypothetical protein